MGAEVDSAENSVSGKQNEKRERNAVEHFLAHSRLKKIPLRAHTRCKKRLQSNDRATIGGA